MKFFKQLSSIFNNNSTQPKVNHQIQSLEITKHNELIVNGEKIDTWQFNGQRLNVAQINGQLEVNGLIYDFDKKKFFPRNLQIIYPLGSR